MIILIFRYTEGKEMLIEIVIEAVFIADELGVSGMLLVQDG